MPLMSTVAQALPVAWDARFAAALAKHGTHSRCARLARARRALRVLRDKLACRAAGMARRMSARFKVSDRSADAAPVLRG